MDEYAEDALLLIQNFPHKKIIVSYIYKLLAHRFKTTAPGE